MEKLPLTKYAIYATKETAPVETHVTEGIQLEAVYKVSGPTRGVATTLLDIDLGGDKIGQFIFDDGTSWICDAYTLHDLFPESDTVSRSADQQFVIPTVLKNTNTNRSIVGDAILSVIKVFAKKQIDNGIKAIAEKIENKYLKIPEKAANKEETLFHVTKNFDLVAFDKKPSTKPFLLFIHGTNSSTVNTFGALKGTDAWEFIQSTYGDNVLAFQHRTLTESPLQNTVKLVDALPNGAVLHIISHSSGGLIADILCKYDKNNGQPQKGFTNLAIDYLKNEKNRKADLECIRTLGNTFLTKNIEIKKYIRVACPAAGTKLVSNRLEHIFNILFNLAGGAANEIAGLFESLIGEILKTKDNIEALPGIEALNTDSPFIKALNDRSPEAQIIDVPLAVISGNSQASLSLKGLGAIVSKLFFWQRNDMFVNTDSMYLGANRQDNIQYFFDQSPLVSHTSYFSNNKTREAILLALKTVDDGLIPGFTSVPQLQVVGTDRSLLEHGELFSTPPTGKKPIVILLPGIMGSNLTKDGTQIWINYWQFLKGGLLSLEDVQDNSISTLSVVKTSYEKLYKQLSFTYDVVVYPFDWRKQLNQSAIDFNAKVIELLKLNQTIKIVAHSMGGMLVRDFIVQHNDTWNDLNTSKDFRLLFLGSPLGGSVRIPTVLFGNDSIINSLSAIDLRHTKKELISMFSTFPGILCLLPLTTEGEKDFANAETWEKMREALGDSDWPIPSAAVLKEFGEYRDGIIAKRDTIDYSKMVYIAGKDKATPCDYFNNMIPPRPELVFLYTGEGDQSVTWDSGIPKQLIDKKMVYYANVTHGQLANDPTLFNGIEDILEKGVTNELSSARPVVRGEEKNFRVIGAHNFDLSQKGIENAILGISDTQNPVLSRIPISVTVSKGDLKYASYPIIAGHFKNDGILNAEKSIDRNLGERLSAKRNLEVYPGEIGTSDIFLSNLVDDDYKGAIILGLGEQGALTAFLLTKTVEQGVANFLISIDKDPKFPNEIGISSLAIGCGYGGLSIENSIKAIIEGVNNANIKVGELLKKDIKTVSNIEFIELYDDRALSCMYALSTIQDKENKLYNIKIANKKIKELLGAKKRLPLDAEEAWWNRMSVKIKEETTPGGGIIRSLMFNSSTGDAREEETQLFSSTALINLFIDDMSTKNNWDGYSAKTIFELMIPNVLKDRLKRKGNIVWVLDEGAAPYPWELLQDSATNAKPLCINAGMIRQLTTTNFMTHIKRVTKKKALIIGDPLLDGFITQLPGAAKEANTVENVMKNFGYANTPIIGKSAAEIVQNLFCDDYKIIHLAGHGVFDPKSPSQSGMVIGKELFLTTADFNQMSTVPELVFVNCCYLGKVSTMDEQYFQKRYQLAANIGVQLIKMGVKAVIAAGWAVEDEAAAYFAESFYTEMFAGSNFGDAVRTARAKVFDDYSKSSNTWGAYQCYGDPFYKLESRSTTRNKTTKKYLIGQEAEIDLNNLMSDLETGSVEGEIGIRRLQAISDGVGKADIRDAAITEKEAFIYGELGEYQLAINKFNDLFAIEKAQFSVLALEKYCNIRTKLAVAKYPNATEQEKEECLTELDTVINRLKDLLIINTTTERYSLLGSAYKRKAIVTNGAARIDTLKAAAYYYYLATKKAVNPSIYTLVNWLQIELLVKNNSGKLWDKKKMETIKVDKSLFIPIAQTDPIYEYELPSREEAIRQLNKLLKVEGNSNQNMDYWQLLNKANLTLCKLLLTHSDNEKEWDSLLADYKKIWKRSGSAAQRKTELEGIQAIHDTLDAKSPLVNELKKLKDHLDEQG